MNYIYHHGILGMKWGIRRYQNKDGSLTAVGKKRYAKLEAQSAKLEAEKKRLTGDKEVPKKTPNPHGKKSIFDMTDDELNQEIARLGLEKRYRDYMKELYPQPKNERYFNGRKVVGEIMSGGLTAVGKNVVENAAGQGVNKLGRELGLDFDLYKKGEKKKESDKK